MSVAACRLLAPGTPVFSTNKTDTHDIKDIVESGVKHHYPNPNPMIIQNTIYSIFHSSWYKIST